MNGETAALPAPNPGRKLTREVLGEAFNRYPIRTHFVEVNENYLDLVDRYVMPYYREGDILSISEKIIALCQGRVKYKRDMKVSLLAKLLSRFAMHNKAGRMMDNPYKMQTAIDLCGPLKVLWAAILSAIGKLFGMRGIFYKVLGNNVANIDGFSYISYEYYQDKGILSPENPHLVCQEIKDTYGIDCMIVDANDLGVEILGKNRDIPYDDHFLAQLIKDNPAGQITEQTPFVLIRRVEQARQGTS